MEIAFSDIELKWLLDNHGQRLALFIAPAEVAGAGVDWCACNPVVKRGIDVFTAFATELADRAVGAEAVPIMEEMIAWILVGRRGNKLPDCLIVIDRFHRDLVYDINHFLHMVQDITQMLIFLFDAGIRIVRQQDIAQDDGEDAKAADDFLGEFMRLCTFKADAAHRISAVGNQAMGK